MDVHIGIEGEVNVTNLRDALLAAAIYVDTHTITLRHLKIGDMLRVDMPNDNISVSISRVP